MTLLFAGLALIVLLLFGAPIYAVLGMPGAAAMLRDGLPAEAMGARVFSQLDSDALVAVPMFILLGKVLEVSGASAYLIGFIDTLVRQFRGGLSMIAIASAVFFAGVMGSSTAEAALLSSTLSRPMASAGYDRKFVAGLLAGGASLGILIPPSIPMLLYAAVTGESPGKLFLAGVLPGLVVGTILMIYAIWQSRRRGYGGAAPASWRERRVRFAQALPVLLLPIFIVVALYTGFSTAAETGAVAAAIAILEAIFIYRTLTLKVLARLIVETTRVSAMLMFIAGMAAIFAFFVTYGRVPQLAAQAVADLQLSAVGFLLVMNVLLILLGVFIEPGPIIFIMMPIVYPVLAPLGIDPIHFGVLMMVNMQLAQLSPPVGFSLFAIAKVAKIPIHDVFAGVTPFMAVVGVGLLIITYVPEISLVLTR